MARTRVVFATFSPSTWIIIFTTLISILCIVGIVCIDKATSKMIERCKTEGRCPSEGKINGQFILGKPHHSEHDSLNIYVTINNETSANFTVGNETKVVFGNLIHLLENQTQEVVSYNS